MLEADSLPLDVVYEVATQKTSLPVWEYTVNVARRLYPDTPLFA